MGTIQLEPITTGLDDDDDDERRRREALAILEQAGVPQALAQVPPPPPPTLPQQVAEIGPPDRPSPRLQGEWERLQRQAQEAQQVGDAYRASLQPQPPTPQPQAPPAPQPQAAPAAPQQPSPPPVQIDPIPISLPAPGSSPSLGSALAQPRSSGPAELSGPMGTAVQLGDPSLRVPMAPVDRGRVKELVRAKLAQAKGEPTVGPEAPREPDFTGADWSDAIRRPLHALANAFKAAGGMQTTPFRSEREAMRARLDSVREQKNREAAQRSQLDIARERLGLDRERMEAQREERSEDRSWRERMQERAAELRAQGMSEREALARAQREQLLGDIRRRESMRDPESPESEMERSSFLAQVELAETSGWRLPEPLRQSLPRLNGEQIRGLGDRLVQQGILRPYTHRRGGARGGGGGGSGTAIPRAQWGSDDDPVVRDAIELGMPEGTARAQATDQRARRTLEGTIARESVRRGREGAQRERQGRVPGWERRPDAPQMSQTEARTVRKVVLADGEFERAVQRIERNLRDISVGDRIMGRLGQGSERYQEVQHALEVVRNQLRQISDMGNSLGSQAMAEHAVPGLDSNTTSGAILRNVRAARRVKHDYVVSLMESYGYEPARGGGSHGGGAAQGGSRATPAGDTVRVRHPDGRIGTIPRARLAAARAAGFEEAQ